jgi:general secretion pathway protein L
MTQGGSLSMRNFSDFVRSAFLWWIDGIWRGVPKSARERWFVACRELVVCIEEGEVVLKSVPESEPLMAFPLDACEQDVAEILAEIQSTVGSAEVTFLVPDNERLVNTLYLPMAAETDLASVLRYELNRVTPFDIDQCRFDFIVRERSDMHQRITVDFVLVESDTLERNLRFLQAIGISPSVITAVDETYTPLPLNLHAKKSCLRLPRLKGAPRPAFLAVAALAIGAALYLPLGRYASLLEDYERRSAEQRQEAIAARAQLDAEDRIVAIGNFIDQQRLSYVSPREVLSELTAALPDGTWLSVFTLRPTKVDIEGESVAPSDLLEIVESLSRLEAAEFRSPVSRSQSTGNQQFSIAARITSSP